MNTRDRSFVVAIMTKDHTFRDMRLTSIGGGADEVTMLIMFIHIIHPSYIPSFVYSILNIFHPSYISSFIYLFNHIFVLVLHHLHHCPSFSILYVDIFQVMLQIICKMMGTLPKPTKKQHTGHHPHLDFILIQMCMFIYSYEKCQKDINKVLEMVTPIEEDKTLSEKCIKSILTAHIRNPCATKYHFKLHSELHCVQPTSSLHWDGCNTRSANFK